MISVNPKKTIGILGGTFDPIHKGHIALALKSQEMLAAQEIWFIPAGRPPHRGTYFEAEQRYKMVQDACREYPDFKVLDIEIKNPDFAYTYDTWTALKAQYPNYEFWLIEGADSARSIHSWYHYWKLLEHANFLVANREGEIPLHHHELTELGFNTHNLKLMAKPAGDLRATSIRKLLEEGQSVLEYVPKAVIPALNMYSKNLKIAV